MTREEAAKTARAYHGRILEALATLVRAANDLAPEDMPDLYDAWRALALAARTEFDALHALSKERT